MKKKKHESCWNYRVVRKLMDGQVCFGIFEVHYKDEKPYAWSAEPHTGWYEEAESAFSDLDMMKAAFKKKVLILDGEEMKEGERMAWRNS